MRARLLRLLQLLCSALLLASVSRVSAAPAGLPAVVNVGASGLARADVEAAVERELRVPLVEDAGAAAHLEITLTGRRANVTYYAPGREPVTRSVDLPRDERRALETIAFLAGNLARDEASELLKQLARASTGEDDATTAPAAPAAAPAASASAAPPPPAPAPAAKPKQPAPAPAPVASKRFVGNVSLWYPLAALKHSEQYELNLELGVAYSHVGAIRGGAGTLGYLRVDGRVQGISLGLLWNRSGPVQGIQASALVNEGYGELRGVSFAPISDVRRGDVHGIQGASFYTYARGVHGIQGSALVAVAGPVHGFQGGVVTSVAQSVEGGQFGLVNVAGNVRGVQVGLVNVADEIHGGAIGLVSIAKNGRFQPLVWLPGPSEPLLVGFKSVTDLTYTEFSLGYDPFGDRTRSDVGVGLHLQLERRFWVETGIAYDELHRGSSGALFSDSSLARSQGRFDVRVGFEPIHGITPFVGGSLTRRIQGGGADFRGEYCFGLALL